MLSLIDVTNLVCTVYFKIITLSEPKKTLSNLQRNEYVEEMMFGPREKRATVVVTVAVDRRYRLTEALRCLVLLG
jgi:hypothetical protein